jgi:SAM-dependent methyltransferase
MGLGARIRQAANRYGVPLHALREKFAFAKRALGSARGNAAFRRLHPDFAVPPLYLLWDAQSYTEYEKYKSSGEQAATLYWDLIQRYVGPCADRILRVCEWGCGPARILRHLPGLAEGHPCRFQFYGTDYNSRSIAWCRRRLRDINFATNRLAPPLGVEDNFFDFLFARSVFTHLSEEMHYAWIRELSRVIRPNGVLAISTQGLAHRERLLEHERIRFDNGEFVVRGLAKEGKLNFSAFHSPTFVREKLLSGFEILEHREGRGTQDLWIARNIE